MPEKKEIDANTSVVHLIQWEMGKLDSAFGKSNANKTWSSPKPYL